jgi:hypothetical protein
MWASGGDEKLVSGHGVTLFNLSNVGLLLWPCTPEPCAGVGWPVQHRYETLPSLAPGVSLARQGAGAA